LSEILAKIFITSIVLMIVSFVGVMIEARTDEKIWLTLMIIFIVIASISLIVGIWAYG
jgi:uncharacterized protein (DUF983 family)